MNVWIAFNFGAIFCVLNVSGFSAGPWIYYVAAQYTGKNIW